MKSGLQIKRWHLVIGALILVFLLCLELAAMSYRNTLRSLNEFQVTGITITAREYPRGQPADETFTLNIRDTKRFLGHLKSAKFAFAGGRHYGGWGCRVRIDTRERSFTFPIYVSDNEGVHIELSSNAGGGPLNLGSLRNDDFRPFLEDVLRSHRELKRKSDARRTSERPELQNTSAQ